MWLNVTTWRRITEELKTVPKESAWVGVMKLTKADWKYPNSELFEKSDAIKKGGSEMSVKQLREELQKAPWIDPQKFVNQRKKNYDFWTCMACIFILAGSIFFAFMVPNLWFLMFAMMFTWVCLVSCVLPGCYFKIFRKEAYRIRNLHMTKILEKFQKESIIGTDCILDWSPNFAWIRIQDFSSKKKSEASDIYYNEDFGMCDVKWSDLNMILSSRIHQGKKISLPLEATAGAESKADYYDGSGFCFEMGIQMVEDGAFLVYHEGNSMIFTKHTKDESYLVEGEV
jgi:hypothetical protein